MAQSTAESGLLPRVKLAGKLQNRLLDAEIPFDPVVGAPGDRALRRAG
jgi:hypothetical protein